MAAKRRRHLDATLGRAVARTTGLALLLGACGGPGQEHGRPAFAPPRHGVFQDPAPLVASTDDDLLPTISPGGGLIAYAAKSNGNLDVMVRPLQGGSAVRLTSHSTDDTDPAFSPDGKHLAWVSQADDVKGDIWVMEADGGDKRRLTGRDTADQAPSWSPDGKTIYFTSRAPGSTLRRVDQVDVATGVRRTVVERGWDPQLSPDGQVLFYATLDSRPRPRIMARRLRDGKEVPITDGSYIEATPHVARGVHGTLVLFARFVDDHTDDGVVDVDDAPSLWATTFDPAQFDGAPTPTARPLTPGEGGEIFASVVQDAPPKPADPNRDFLVYTAAGRGALEIHALPLDGVISQSVGPEAVLEAGRSADDPALRRLALRYLVATTPSLAGPARYELGRELAERGKWGDAIDALERAIDAAAGQELALVAKLEKERLLMLKRLRGKLLLREDADRAYVRERLAAVQSLAASTAGGTHRASPAQARARSISAEAMYALLQRDRAVTEFEALAHSADVPAEDGARALDRLGEIYAGLGDLEAVARVSEESIRRFGAERYYARRAAERWVETAQAAPGVPRLAALETIAREQKDVPQVAARATAALATLQASNGEDTVALVAWQHIVDTFASERDILQEALLAVGRGAASVGNDAVALAAYERLLAEFPEVPHLRSQARRGITAMALASATAQEQRGDFAAARQTYARLLLNNNALAVAHRRFIALSVRLGARDAVLRSYKDSATRLPRDKFARYGYGYALTFADPPDLSRAHAEMEATLELDPRFVAAHLTMGWIREQRERREPGHNWLEGAAESYETARSFVDRVTDRDIWAAATLNKGNALFALGKFDDAFAAYLERELSDVPFDAPLTELLFRESFARAALREGNLDVALDMAQLAQNLSRALPEQPRGSATTALMAALSLQAGRYPTAIRLYDNAADSYRARADWQHVVPMLRGKALAQHALGQDDGALATLAAVLDIVGRGKGPPAAPHGMLITEIPANPKNVTAAVYGFDASQEEEIARANTARILRRRGNLGAAKTFAARRLILTRTAVADSRQGPRLQTELLYALHETAVLLAAAGELEPALALWDEAMPILGAEERWQEAAPLLESVQAVWLAAPHLRRGHVAELAQLTAENAVTALKDSDRDSQRLYRWLALEHLARRFAPPEPAPKVNPMADALTSLDSAVLHAQSALDAAQKAGNPALLAHVTAVVTGTRATAPDPQADAPLGWRALFDRALWDHAANERVDARWLRAAIDAFEVMPQPARAPERAAFIAAACGRLLADQAAERAWALLERDRLLELQPPLERVTAEPWQGAWNRVIASRADKSKYVPTVTQAPALVRALEGVPPTLAQLRTALEGDAALLQIFAAGAHWHWFVIDAKNITHVLTNAPADDAAPAASAPPAGPTMAEAGASQLSPTLVPNAVRAALGETFPKALYVDAGALLRHPAAALSSGGRPLGAQVAVAEVLSAGYLVAAYEARTAARNGILEIGARTATLPGAEALPADQVSLTAVRARATGRSLVVLGLPSAAFVPAFERPGATQMTFGSAQTVGDPGATPPDAAERLDLDTLAATPLDNNVVLLKGPVPTARARRALSQSLLLAGSPTLVLAGQGPGADALAAHLAAGLQEQPAATLVAELQARGEMPPGGMLMGYRGLDADARVLFAMNEFLRLFKAGNAAFKAARDSQQTAQWLTARDAFVRLREHLALLKQPDSRERLSKSHDKTAQRIPAMLGKLEQDSQGNLAQVYLAIKQIDAAAALQEAVLKAAEAANDTKMALDTMRSLGRTLSIGKRHSDSAARFVGCAELAAKIGDKITEADCRSQLGVERRELFDYAGAQQAYNAAVELYAAANSASIVQPRRFLGFLFESALNNYDKAQEQFQQALVDADTFKNTEIVPRLLLDIARVNRQRGDYEQALVWVEKAQLQVTHAAPTDRAEAALEAAKIYWYRGHYRRALELEKQGLAWAREAGNAFLEIQARSLEGLVALNQGELQHAETAIRDALTLSRLTGRRAEEAAQLNNLGIVLREAGRLDEAILGFRQALRIDEELGSIEGRAFDLRNLAVALERQGKPQDGLTAVGQALGLSRSIGNRYNELQCLFAKAEILEALHDPGALPAFREAATMARQITVPEVEWRALYGMGRLTRGHDASQARQALDQALAVAERLGRGRQEATPGKSRDDLYADAILLAVHGQDLAAAHAYAERARARAGLDVLASGAVELPDPRAKSLLDAETASREAWLTAQRAAEQGDASARARLQNAEAEHQAAAARLVQAFPRLARLFMIAPVPLGALQKRLPNDTAVLSYFWGSAHGIALIITARTVKAVELIPSAQSITEQVAALRRKMGVFAPVSAELTDLGQALLEPVWEELKTVRTIAIVPHGALFHVPFAALPVHGAPLLERAVLAWALSGSQLYDQLGLSPQPRPARIAAVAHGDDLPFARLEASAVAASAARLGADADVSAVQWASSTADALDIAAHAVVDVGDPLASALMLAPGAHDDGRLEVRQIYGMPRMPALVTLSGCDTGTANSGAEWLSLGQSFLAAGAHTVVASQNRVSDLASAVLMKRFFRLAVKHSPAEALRDAALAVRGTFAHPAHWANFVLLGDFR